MGDDGTMSIQNLLKCVKELAPLYPFFWHVIMLLIRNPECHQRGGHQTVPNVSGASMHGTSTNQGRSEK